MSSDHPKAQNRIFLNRGIEPLLRNKWLFYAICNAHKILKPYIPPTTIATLNTLGSSINPEELMQERLIFKPSNSSGGKGVAVLPASFATEDEFNTHLSELVAKGTQDREIRSKILGEGFEQNQVFLLQKYLHSGSKSKPISTPVIRIYAFVLWDNTTKKLLISIDNKAAYQHIRKDQEKNGDFTLENNDHLIYRISEEEVEQLRKFLKDFFTTLLCRQNRIHYQHWEYLAKQYIKENHSLNDERRLSILSQFVDALYWERRHTSNRLSHYQCFLLNRFVECYKAKDFDKYRETQFVQTMQAAFNLMLGYNFQPYRDERYYPLQNVAKSYRSLTLFAAPKLGIDAKAIKNYIDSNFSHLKDYQTTDKHHLDSYTKLIFEHLSHEDLSAISATSQGLLEKVDNYARNVVPR